MHATAELKDYYHICAQVIDTRPVEEYFDMTGEA